MTTSISPDFLKGIGNFLQSIEKKVKTKTKHRRKTFIVQNADNNDSEMSIISMRDLDLEGTQNALDQEDLRKETLRGIKENMNARPEANKNYYGAEEGSENEDEGIGLGEQGNLFRQGMQAIVDLCPPVENKKPPSVRTDRQAEGDPSPKSIHVHGATPAPPQQVNSSANVDTEVLKKNFFIFTQSKSSKHLVTKRELFPAPETNETDGDDLDLSEEERESSDVTRTLETTQMSDGFWPLRNYSDRKGSVLSMKRLNETKEFPPLTKKQFLELENTTSLSLPSHILNRTDSKMIGKTSLFPQQLTQKGC